jgi:hypothetical protein
MLLLEQPVPGVQDTWLNGRSSSQILRRYGASALSARARRNYDLVMDGFRRALPRSAAAGPPLCLAGGSLAWVV